MENKELNIAAILKDKPKGTMLWSDTFGKAELLCMNQGSYPICLGLSSGISIELTEEGKYFKDVVESLCCIFPSRNMRDWSKFAWKKGDVLGFANVIVIFDCWVEDDYTEFQAAFECNQGGEYDEGNDYYTSEFDKVSSDIAQEFIKNVEAHYGGKLNLETLEIEREPKQECEFKTFDKVLVRDNDDEGWIPAIFIRISDSDMYPYGCNSLCCSGEENFKKCIHYEGNEDMAFTDKPF